MQPQLDSAALKEWDSHYTSKGRNVGYNLEHTARGRVSRGSGCHRIQSKANMVCKAKCFALQTPVFRRSVNAHILMSIYLCKFKVSKILTLCFC